MTRDLRFKVFIGHQWTTDMGGLILQAFREFIFFKIFIPLASAFFKILFIAVGFQENRKLQIINWAIFVAILQFFLNFGSKTAKKLKL